MIRFIEELSFNAWPALQTLHYDGWILRFAEGYARRANSVNPVYESSLPTHTKISFCQQLYSARGLDTVFKITEAVQPNDLDSILEVEGYRQEALTSVQTVSLLDRQFGPAEVATFSSTQFSESWLNDYFRLTGRDKNYLLVTRRLHQNIFPETCYMSIRENDANIALGLGVLERGYLGIYDIVTAPEGRNRGLATQLMSQLLAWGQSNGAEHAYLQVMTDNAPALRLYNKLGFVEVYQYWYRVKAQPDM